MGAVLVGRAPEVARLEGLLATARSGRSGVLVLRGEAGVGKTTLVAHAVAAASGMTVLRTRAGESERYLPYAGLFDLFRPVTDHLDALEPVQRAALRGALLLDEPARHDRFATGVAALSLLAGVAEARPVLVAVDEAQWLDSASAETLGFVARRLDAEAVALLFAVREGEGPDTFAGLEELRVEGLPYRDAVGLVALAAPTPVAPAVAAQLAEATAGNPLALEELAASLPAEELNGSRPLSEPLPVGPRLHEAFEAQLAALPDSTRRMLGVAALSAGPLSEIGDAAAVLGADPAHLQLAATRGLVTLTHARVRFRHPLVRSAAEQQLSSDERLAVHRALADASAARGDLERRAWHLAASTPEPEEGVAAILESAARSADRRGASSWAIGAWERAARLSPEPAAGTRRLVAAAETALVAGDPVRAGALLGRTDAGSEELLGAKIDQLRARLAMFGGPPLGEALRRLTAAAGRVESLDPELATSLLVDGALAGLFSGDWADAEQVADRAVTLASAIGGPCEALARTARAAARALRGDDAGGEDLVGSCRAFLRLSPTMHDGQLLVHNVVLALAAIERYEEAQALLDEFVATARRRQALGALPMSLAFMSNTAFLLNDWTTAYVSGGEALVLAAETGTLPAELLAHLCLALVDAAQGRDDECYQHFERAIALIDATGVRPLRPTAHVALALLALGRERPWEALAHLDEVERLLRSLGGYQSSGLLRWEGNFIDACLATGRRNDAERVIALVEARAAAKGGAWAHAIAARGRGQLAAADFDEPFREALTWDDRCHYPFERARTELCWAQRLRTAGRPNEAVSRLRGALAGFEALHAQPWVERVGEELAACGAAVPDSRGHDVVDLKPVELQVALAVAGGSPISNVATSMFLSRQTVEEHLAAAYRHLRVETPAALSRRLDTAAAPALLGEPSAALLPAPAPEVRGSITLLGDFRVQFQGRTTVPSGQSAQVIAFVAARGKVHLDEVLELLWPDSNPDEGRTRLRNVLTRVRRSAGDVLVRHRELIRLAEDVEVDLLQFEVEADRALLARRDDDRGAVDLARSAVSRYGGEFLPAARYEDWTVATRERVHSKFVALLDLLAEDAALRGEPDDAVALIQRAIEQSPYDEERYVRAARLLLGQNRRGHARRLLERAREAAADLGVAPSPALTEVEEQLGRRPARPGEAG